MESSELTGTEQAVESNPYGDPSSFIELPRLGGLELSHDGNRLVVGVSRLNHDSTSWVSSLWEVDHRDGGPARRLTRSVEGDAVAAFTRDGDLLFTSRRATPATGDSKESVKVLWALPRHGGEAREVGRRDGGWGGIATAADSDALVLLAPAHVGTLDAEADAERRNERREKKISAILHEGHPVRYWDSDLGPEQLRVFATCIADGAETGELRDLTGDVGARIPEDASLTRDGRTLFVGWQEPLPHGEASASIVAVDVESGERTVWAEGDEQWEYTHVVANPAGPGFVCLRDSQPRPDSAPDSALHLVTAPGEGKPIAEGWDRWPAPFAFSPDGGTIYVTADDLGDTAVFAVTVADGQVRRITGPGVHTSCVLSPQGDIIYAIRSAWDNPGEIVAIDVATGDARVLDSGVAYPQPKGKLEKIQAVADDGVTIHGYLVLPEGEGPHPLALWIHGGPLGSFAGWSWRWCPWLLASQGYAVLLPDPALSTGYGLDFIKRGWGTWGERPYTDLMAITDHVETRDDIDETRTCAMGGSFGGYMSNWVAGHTDRFDAIVTHASLWNLTTFGHTTDFPVYWERQLTPERQLASSPHLHADNITTPMLVIHGDKDYRVPIGEGLALWWDLVRRHEGDPADMKHKFLYFPDENHWILTPQHAVIWYETVRAFLAHHVLGEEFHRPDSL